MVLEIKRVSKGAKKGEFRFLLKGDNGETIAQSESYTQKHNILEIASKAFPAFIVVDKSKKEKEIGNGSI